MAKLGLDLLNELAEALGLPEECCGITIEANVDDVARLEVRSLITDKQTKEITKVCKRYDFWARPEKETSEKVQGDSVATRRTGFREFL